MGDETAIGWTDRTLNWWEGCTKVSPGCDRCYAEARNLRWVGGANWGPGAPRRLTSAANRAKVARWDREAAAGGPRWVFCSSLADVFDNEVDPAWREGLFDAMRRHRNLRFQVLTKRVGLAARMLPPDWPSAFPHCGLMATVVDQAEAERDLPKLAATPAAWRGVSYEPALGPLDLRALATRGGGAPATWDALAGVVRDGTGAVVAARPGVDWVVVGGESGGGARPFDVAWARAVVADCAATGVPAFVKQTGANPVGVATAHRKGEDPAEWPEDLRVRQMPRAYGVEDRWPPPGEARGAG